mmetsp:Transcript_15942/g.22710  ORF Transcript_15942/g.22710 Transcript_15942/m.22710 type:complete len:371 (+) Transcript_15942:149-1261(+)|eukprot:CAMPEP_0184868072 /NCGR_PEP_ID=MMETSP0580-20130426/29013_1 /TAXON_ID=1118495 /ORGANISM="Dactyliosolen fragilissimus" /LENGTH=370 /DNA_ID=CAMNT_0027368717 /DNA_START=52 /DNA_END=1164 /DNA_ORIENTATION=-
MTDSNLITDDKITMNATSTANPNSFPSTQVQGGQPRPKPPSSPTPFRDPMTVEDDDINAAPLHLHAIRIPARLHGSMNNSKPYGSTHSRSSSASRSRSSLSRPTSRDPSPSPSDYAVAGGTYYYGASSSVPHSPSASSTVSSLAGGENMNTSSANGNNTSLSCAHQNSPSIASSFGRIHIDPDIFLDRQGLEELDSESLTGGAGSSVGGGNEKHGVNGHVCIASNPGLPSVNERMSDEALEDCHAFTDLRDVIRQNLGGSASGGAGGGAGVNSNLGCPSAASGSSREGSVTGGSIMGDASCALETLKEFEEEISDEEEKSDGIIEEEEENDDEDDEGGNIRMLIKNKDGDEIMEKDEKCDVSIQDENMKE